jgi:hypothetical protein
MCQALVQPLRSSLARPAARALQPDSSPHTSRGRAERRQWPCPRLPSAAHLADSPVATCSRCAAPECRLRPCLHAALCVDCAEGLRARGFGCPICSAKIEALEKGTFMRTFTVDDAAA